MQVALGPAEQAAARWQALQPLDVTTLETGSFGLLPLLYERLRDVAPDEPQLPRLFGTYRAVWYRNQLFLDRISVLLPLLRQRAPVQPLLVGGTSALVRWYPSLGLRPLPQAELIVEREAAAETVKVSTYAGWRPAAETRSSTVLRDETGRILVVHHGPPAAMVGPLGEDGLTAIRERALELPSVEGAPLVLDPADELLYACATGARAVNVPTFQWLIDVDRLLRAPDASDPGTLLERASRVHLVAPVRAVLHYLAAVNGDDVMSDHLAVFDAASVGRRDRIAFALAGVGGNGLAGGAQVLANYLQATAEDAPLRAAVRLPRHLQERWGAKTLAEVPVLAVRKALRLPRSQARASAPERNRSASS
jgi:hypothetical protein